MATWKKLTLVKTDHIEVDVNLDHVIYMVRELRGFFDLAPQKEQREATRRTADVPTRSQYGPYSQNPSNPFCHWAFG